MFYLLKKRIFHQQKLNFIAGSYFSNKNVTKSFRCEQYKADCLPFFAKNTNTNKVLFVAVYIQHEFVLKLDGVKILSDINVDLQTILLGRHFFFIKDLFYLFLEFYS